MKEQADTAREVDKTERTFLMYQRGHAFVRAMKPDGTFHDKVDVLDLDDVGFRAWVLDMLVTTQDGDGDCRPYEIDANAVYRYVAVLGA